MQDKRPATQKCVALKCKKRVSRKKMMCDRHWAMVPAELKVAVAESYNIGQDAGGKIPVEFRRAVARAVLAVADKEGVALPPVTCN